MTLKVSGHAVHDREGSIQRNGRSHLIQGGENPNRQEVDQRFPRD